MTTDEEIREMIRTFREDYSPKYRVLNCPFQKWHILNNDTYEQRLCSICSYIFNTMPPRSNEYLCGLGYFTKLRYNRRVPNCPCSLYGPKYTAEKIAEFMMEI